MAVHDEIPVALLFQLGDRPRRVATDNHRVGPFDRVERGGEDVLGMLFILFAYSLLVCPDLRVANDTIERDERRFDHLPHGCLPSLVLAFDRIAARDGIVFAHPFGTSHIGGYDTSCAVCALLSCRAK